ncbi:F-box domain-containing protein [Mycena sanguinolenta]|uniref:F-box domain-containing protein n=1 Tax=Mycena sanguinolenta TaxID=230812 RepID=A0A8H7CWP8_9AGAR|nr:F-box domain-containing protein [Mycena sanguinolenta]
MLSTLEADRAHVAALTAQILDLENSIRVLQLEREKAQSRLDSYKYPVLALPTEIVTEIFLRIPPSYPVVPSPAETRSLAALACICREWREIALSIPSLWKAINFLDLPSEHRVHNSQLWLQRSRSCPLSIEFDAGDTGNLADVFKFLTLGAHRARCEHMKLGLFPRDLPLMEGSMPLLRHLDLELHNGSPIRPVSLSEAPLLRSAVLNSEAASWVLLPWTQLTSLVLNGVILRDCFTILEQTPNLIHCELYVGSNMDDRNRVISLPRLESLVLQGLAHPFMPYLQSLATPALCHLTITEPFLGHNPFRSLTDFISESASKLQEVRVIGKKRHSRKRYREALPSVPRFSFGPRELKRRAGEEDFGTESDYYSSDSN